MVAGWTSNNQTASAAVFCPESTKCKISFRWFILSFRGRPPTRPCFRAASKPLRIRSRNISNWDSINSLTLHHYTASRRGHVNCFDQTAENSSTWSILSIKINTSFKDRDRQSSFQTTNTSPLRHCPKSPCNSGRSHRHPEALYWKICSYPVTFSASIVMPYFGFVYKLAYNR